MYFRYKKNILILRILREEILTDIKELNENGYFKIDIKENKVGRKVDSIDFIVKSFNKKENFKMEF